MKFAYEPLEIGKCDWCEADLGLRVFHFEGKRYCCRDCMDTGASREVGRPLFETKPFPPALSRLRAHVPQQH